MQSNIKRRSPSVNRHETQRPTQAGTAEVGLLLVVDLVGLAFVGLFAALAFRLLSTTSHAGTAFLTRLFCAAGGLTCAYMALAFLKDHPWVQALRTWWRDIQEPFDFGD